MLSKLKRSIALAAIFVAGSAGAAQATEGWYGRLDVGTGFDVSADDGSDNELDEGIAYGGGIGYAFANGFRLEGELSTRQDTNFLAQEIGTTEVMLNGYYDFNRGGRFEPYVGLGVGMANYDLDFADEDAMAWQAMAGVAIGLTERLDLDIGYRYFTIPEADFGTEVDYKHHGVFAGLRWQFGAPAAAPVVAPPPTPPQPVRPPPPPPPAACPVSEFVVYFEWDRSALNQAALETIDAAVARARQCNVSAVTVVGHTDTSGATAYNQGLSERRASVVRDALVARGIAGGAITSSARGETELARATRDGVREPLNRRTAVTIRFR